MLQNFYVKILKHFIIDNVQGTYLFMHETKAIKMKNICVVEADTCTCLDSAEVILLCLRDIYRVYKLTSYGYLGIYFSLSCCLSIVLVPYQYR